MALPLNWVEVSKSAIFNNVKTFRSLIGDDKLMCCAVKGNAYGHGLTVVSKLIAEAGADWLGVNALFEAEKLREAGVVAPIYIMGYIPFAQLEQTIMSGFHFVVYNKSTLLKSAEIGRKLGKKVYTHLKLETGNNRQGVSEVELRDILEIYKSAGDFLELTGLATHFSNIEETDDHSYAKEQLKCFEKLSAIVESEGFVVKYKHCANSAATMVLPRTHFNMIRPGCSIYGYWPSRQTQLSAMDANKKIELIPVLTWKTCVAQIRNVPEGAFVGYGCTYKTTVDSILAVLPVGYYDGYDRKLSNLGHVLINGQRAPIRGRVAMNMIVADVTHIREVKLEDEVVLIGKQGDEQITVEQMASWANTINYEVVTRINECLPRVVVD